MQMRLAMDQSLSFSCFSCPWQVLLLLVSQYCCCCLLINIDQVKFTMCLDTYTNICLFLRLQVRVYSLSLLNIHRSGVLTALAWLLPHETAAVTARSVYTIQPCTMSLHAKPHTWGACVFSCNLPPAHLAEWPESLRVTAVTRGWKGYRN